MGRKKKQRRPPNTEGGEAAEELAALEAIYGDDIQIDDDRHGFSLRVLPHPAELQENLVSTVLSVRLPANYPYAEATLRLRDHGSLALSEQRALSKQLHAAAAGFAADGAVCAFDLINSCQAFLQERNVQAAAHPDTAAAPSLWHTMQQREEDAAGANQEGGSPTSQDVAMHAEALDSSLFGGSQPAQPLWSATSPPQQQQAAAAAQRHTARVSGHDECVADGFASQTARPAAAGVAATLRTRSATSLGAGPAIVGRRGSGGEVSGSLVRSVFDAVRSGFSAVGRALLPPSLHQLLDGGSEAGSEGSVSSQDSAAGSVQPERDALRRDVLTGHLLALATEDGLPRHALPALATSLQARGLLPKWVQWALMQQPALFNRAFRRLFAQEINAASAAPGGDPLSAWALERFWRPAAGGVAAQPPEPLPVLGASAGGTSRYLTDFQEVAELGRGASGVVVAAVNRLDGRQYALKRIRLDAKTPAGFARLLREVSTLSRLQHPHVVRYFQAWFETDDGSGSAASPAAGGRATSASDDWLASDSAQTSLGGSSSALAGVSFLRSRQGLLPSDLQPVAEESQTGGTGVESSASSSALQSGPAEEATAEQEATTASRASHLTSESSGAGFWQSPGETTGSSIPAEAPASAADAAAAPAMRSPGTGTVDAGDRSDTDSAAGATHDAAADSRQTAPRQVLFIQMEYCPRTLRQALDGGALLKGDGAVDEAATWQVVRQMLSGLAHIHAQGIIHRDLNPNNLFFDARGEIRLGDFGLAKFTAAGADDDADVQAAAAGLQRPAGVGLQSEASGVMGTSFYISPEIEQGATSYDERVDIFSAGVTVFELFRPFATGMERVITLRELRDTGRLPGDFAAQHPQAAQLVSWLMAADAPNRPTARQALASELLPPTVGDQALADMLRSLPDSPETLDRVVAAVFASAAPVPASAAAAADAAGTPLPLQMGARDWVVEALRSVFSRHGAVAATSAAMGLATDEDDRAGAPLLLAPSGERLALRHEMRRPFAAWLARQAAAAAQAGETVESLRRYEIATVRRRGGGRGPPAAHLAADLDFVAPRAATAAEAALLEAEVILAAVEAAAAVPEAGAVEVRLGHRALLEAALRFANLPGGRDARAAAQQLLSTAAGASPAHAAARAKAWPAIRVGLLGMGLDGAALGRCRALVLQLPGEAAAALHRLRSRLAPQQGGPLPAPLAAALDHLQALVGHLAAWGVAPAAIVVDPLLPPHAEHFAAALWQVHLLHPATGATQLLAVGGRYDALLARLWPAAAVALGAPPGAVGVTLSADRLVAAVSGAAASGFRPERPGLPPRPSQADVLVCARGGGGLLRERMALVAALWAAGLAAELLPAAAPSATAQYEYARAAGIAWMVTLQAATLSSSDTVVVKNLERKGAEEEAVPYADVARFLQDAIASGLRHGGPRADLQRGASLLAPAADGEHGASAAGEPAWGQDAASGHGGAGTPGWREGRRRGRR